MKHWSALRGFGRQVSKQMEAEKQSYAVYGNVCGWGRHRSRGGGGSRINLTSPLAMPCPPSQFDKYQKSTRNENASNFLCCQSPFVCSVHFAGFSPAFVPQSLSLSVDGFWHLRTSTVIDWHWLGLRWIIPRNAADRYHDSTATLANPYIDTGH